MDDSRNSFEDSQGIYGSSCVHCDLRETGNACGEKRVARLGPARPDQVWVTDITCIRIHGGWLVGDDFNCWCKYNHLVPSMSRRGNCWDNAIAQLRSRYSAA